MRNKKEEKDKRCVRSHVALGYHSVTFAIIIFHRNVNYSAWVHNKKCKKSRKIKINIIMKQM